MFDAMDKRYQFLLGFLIERGVLTEKRYGNGTWSLQGIYGVDDSGLRGAGRTPEEALDNAIVAANLDPEAARKFWSDTHAALAPPPTPTAPQEADAVLGEPAAAILLAEQVLHMEMVTERGKRARELARRVLAGHDETLRYLHLIVHATAPSPDDGGHHEAAHDLASQAIEALTAPVASRAVQAEPAAEIRDLLCELGNGVKSSNWRLAERAFDMSAKFLVDQPLAAPAAPIDMVLHCPACGLQHIDAPEVCACGVNEHGNCNCSVHKLWHNPPHRSHLCHGCGHVWRPADVRTNGVQAVHTRGKADSPTAPAATAEPSSRTASAAPRDEIDEVTGAPWQLLEMARRVSAAYRDGTLSGYEIRYLDDMIERAEKLPTAARDVLMERRRQVSSEGWTPSHDDDHRDGELSYAAAGYACSASDAINAIEHELDGQGEPTFDDAAELAAGRPWPAFWDFKAAPPRRQLVKAGALILAEIERLDRLGTGLPQTPTGQPCRRAEATQSILALVGLEPSLATIAGWSSEQDDEAVAWASATHLRASDNDLDVPLRPPFLPDPWKGPYNDTGDVFGGPTPTPF